jgi:hypothetical protein
MTEYTFATVNQMNFVEFQQFLATGQDKRLDIEPEYELFTKREKCNLLYDIDELFIDHLLWINRLNLIHFTVSELRNALYANQENSIVQNAIIGDVVIVSLFRYKNSWLTTLENRMDTDSPPIIYNQLSPTTSNDVSLYTYKNKNAELLRQFKLDIDNHNYIWWKEYCEKSKLENKRL